MRAAIAAIEWAVVVGRLPSSAAGQSFARSLPLCGPTGKVKPPKRKIGRHEAADHPFVAGRRASDQDAAGSAEPPAVACNAW